MRSATVRFAASRCAAVAALALLAAGAAPAQGPTASPLAATLVGLPERIVVGESFAFELRVSNPGPASPMTRATFRLPASLRLAASPDCPWTFDREPRQWVSEGRWAPGETRTCRVQLIAPENTGAVVLAIDVATFQPDTYGGVQQEVPMVSPPAPGKVLFRLGRVNFRALEVGVLVFFLLFFGSLLLGRLQARRQGRSAFSGLASGYNFFAFGVLCAFFLLYFAFLALEDRRALREFREARCEVLDAQAEMYRHQGRPGLKDAASFDARLVVAYELDGQRMVTLAGRPASFLDLSQVKAEALLQSLEQKSAIPCWVDPADRRQVLIDRGFGGAYLFALIPLGGLLLILWWWRSNHANRR